MRSVVRIAEPKVRIHSPPAESRANHRFLSVEPTSLILGRSVARLPRHYIRDMNSICKLCKNEATLIKAHVIPKSFWEIDASQPTPRMVTNTEGVFPKRIPIGVYDQTIVCEPCERSFSDYDSYAAHLFLSRFHEFEEVRDNNRRLTGYVFSKAWDHSLLKLFAIAVALASVGEFTLIL